jgi:hypothetical protein
VARSSTTRATLLLVAAFVAGGLIGGATMMVADKARHENAGTRTPRPGYAERLTTELDLTSEQRQAVEAILERHVPRMDSVWRALRNAPELDAVRQSIRDEIRSQLTVPQQERYQAMLDRQERDDTKGGRGGNPR